ENRGLLKRETDPLYKLLRLVYLTGHGQTVLAASIPLGDRVDVEFLGRLIDEEREQFTLSLIKMMP
ncbi:transcriptional regulator, partial [Salmonella enterica subsp. enterica serovar Kentucky]